MLRFTLEGQSNVTYIIQGSCDLSKLGRDGDQLQHVRIRRHICVPAGGNQNFYRAMSVALDNCCEQFETDASNSFRQGYSLKRFLLRLFREWRILAPIDQLRHEIAASLSSQE